MVTKRIVRDVRGCVQLEQGYDEGEIKIKTILKEPVPGSKDVHTVFFIQILASLGENPSKFLKLKGTTSCLMRKGVKVDGQKWDWYLMQCPTGPPCHFLDTIE